MSSFPVSQLLYFPMRAVSLLQLVPIVLGKYEFCNLSPGSYVVLEINLPGFGDVSDTDGANDNSIRVQLGVGERSPGHDFVDERVPGTPAPTPVGQTAVPTSGSPVGTPGPTPLGQTPFPTPGLPSSTPAPTPPGQTLAPTSGQPVITPAPTTSILGCISGTVREDTNNDNTGDVVLSGVAITLFSDAGGFVATRRTDSLGKYEFCNLSPGSYVVLEINLPGFGDVSDTDGANDNSIRVQLGVGERSPGHDFVDERVPGTPAPTPVGQTAVPTSGSPAGTPGPTPLGQTPFPTPGLPSSTPAPTPLGQTLAPTSGQPVITPAPATSILGCISGTVREDTNNDNTGDVVLSGVAITLFSDAGGFVATTRTDSLGKYEFCNLSPGSYVVLEINLPGFGDVSDTDGANDNSIRVQLGVGERSPGHDFVDERVPGTPAPTPVGQTAVPTSGSPVGTPGPTPLGQTPISHSWPSFLDASSYAAGSNFGSYVGTASDYTSAYYVYLGLHFWYSEGRYEQR